ncbi:MAG: hypothetical protein AAF483_27840, partial [Planctomycetota bacterium]
PTISRQSKNFGSTSNSHTSPVWSRGDVTTLVGFDQRGLIVRTSSLADSSATNQTGQLPSTRVEYDELGFERRSYLLAAAFYNAASADYKPQFVFETNPLGNVVESVETRVATGEADQQFTNSFQYDEQGRVIQQTLDAGDNLTVTTDFERLVRDNTSFINRPSLKTTTDGISEKQFFDSQGRVVVALHQYDGNANSQGRTNNYYDAAGRLTRTEFVANDGAARKQTDFEHDALHRLRKKTRFEFSGPFGGATPFSVDYFDYFDDQYWSVIAYQGVPAALSGDDLKLRGSKTKQDAVGKTIIAQQPFAGTSAEYNSNDPGRDAGIQVSTYDYLSNLELMATTTRLSQGPFGEISTGNLSPNTPPRVSLAYEDTRIRRVVQNSTGEAVLTLDRLTERDALTSIGTQHNLINPGFRVLTRNVIDEAGNIVRSFDAIGNQTSLTYDYQGTGSGGLELTQNSRGDTRVSSVEGKFDSSGNQLFQQHVKQQGAANNSSPPIVWEYDGLGRRTKESTTVATHLNNDDEAVTEAVTRSWAYPNVRTTSFTNRNDIITEAITSTNQQTRTITTRENGVAVNTLTQEYYSDGTLERVDDQWTGGIRAGSTSTIDYSEYHSLGLISQESFSGTFSGVNLAEPTFSRSPHPEGPVESTVFMLPSPGGLGDWGFTRTNTVDNLGRIVSVTQGDKRADYTFNVDHAVASINYLEDIDNDDVLELLSTSRLYNSVQNQSGFDPDGRPAHIEHRTALGKELATYSNKYDLRGLLTESERTLGATKRSHLTTEFVAFSYTDSGELESLGQRANSESPIVYTQLAGQDGNGNRQTSTIGAGERLLKDERFAYRYDLEGNLVERTFEPESIPHTITVDNSTSLPRTEITLHDPDSTEPGAHGDQSFNTGRGRIASAKFLDIAPGTYDLWSTWEPRTDGAIAEYRIHAPYLSETGTADFTLAPSYPPDAAGRRWELIATLEITNSGDIQVDVGIPKGEDVGNKALIFDAIQLTPSVVKETYSWDHRNQLELATQLDRTGDTVNEVSFGFDGLGRHVFTNEDQHDRLNGTTESISDQHVYDGNSRTIDVRLRDEESLGIAYDAQRYFIGNGGQVLAVNSRSRVGFIVNPTVWYYRDLAGVARTLRSTEGVAHRSFNSYGQLVNTTGDLDRESFDINPVIWKNSVLNESLGLYPMPGRLYDAGTGRYVTESVISPGGNPHPYEFAHGNPQLSFGISDDLRREQGRFAEGMRNRTYSLDYDQRVQIYGPWFGGGGWNYFWGEGLRMMVPDESLAYLSDRGTYGVATASAASLVLGGWALRGVQGLGLGARVLASAGIGAAEYTAITSTAQLFNTNPNTYGGPTIEGAATFAAFGAAGVPMAAAGHAGLLSARRLIGFAGRHALYTTAGQHVLRASRPIIL